MSKTATTTQRYQKVLSAVHMVYRLVNSTFNVHELLLRLTRLVSQLVQASSVSVHILDPEQKRVELIASFNGKINLLLEKRSELSMITPEERAVSFGQSIARKRLIAIPLVADDNVGAIFVRRGARRPEFNEFDKELLTVIAEQVVTALRNLQLYEEQQRITLGSIKSIGRLLGKQFPTATVHAPAYFKVVRILADELHMRRDEIASLEYASILHDAGVIDVPYDILSKSSQLTPAEFKVIRDHPAKSVELIKPVGFLKPVLPIILYHHEKYDGTGYPSGLKKEQIPLGARLMAVVDAFEAMVQGRPYRKPLSIKDALDEIKRNSGTQFDPRIVNTFLRISRLKKIRKYLSLLKG